MPTFFIPSQFARFLLALLMAVSLPLSANDHGGGASAPQPLVFTVNLGSNSYLQVGLVLETATPEAAHALTVYRPRIQHEIIMLLSQRDEAGLRTLEGKHQLMEDILEAVNQVIDETKKTGVTEVLLSNFIIQ